MLPVTKSYLPNKDKYKVYVDEIFDSCHLTNSGPLLQKLEARLAEYLGVKHVICVANGTLALQVAYKALNLKGSVVTSPFSFAATSSSMTWEGLRPIFCDIDEKTLNLNVEILRSKIDNDTSAIVPVHVFGNPCDVKKIEEIAHEHDLKVIYDAAHAFDVNYEGQSILNYGDISTLSFHATKIFHTIEGGAIVTNCKNIDKTVRELINFGIHESGKLLGLGTNAKMNEFEAAMGLCILDDIDKIKLSRLKTVSFYRNALSGLPGISLQQSEIELFSYMPVIFDSEEVLLHVISELMKNDIVARRYFYPSLNQAILNNDMGGAPISESISRRIMCLPLFADIKIDEVKNVIKVIKEALK